MPSLFDSQDATRNTQEMDTSASLGSIKRDGSMVAEAQQNRRQLRRTANDGGASDSTTVVAQPKAESKVEQKSLNKIMLKAILKTHQTMRDLSSTVWDTLLMKASSLEADSMQEQTQTDAEKVRQEGRGHTRGPPFVWAYLGLIKSLQQRGNTAGARTCLQTFVAKTQKLILDVKKYNIFTGSQFSSFGLLKKLHVALFSRSHNRCSGCHLKCVFAATVLM